MHDEYMNLQSASITPTIKGCGKDPKYYRLFGKILQPKLRVNIGYNISEEQSEFMPSRSCVDNLFIMQQISEKKITNE